LLKNRHWNARRGRKLASELRDDVDTGVRESVQHDGTVTDSFDEARPLGANFAGARLASADLMEARLDGTNLDHADLADANLWNASLIVASLKQACLVNADLRQARLTKANLQSANLNLATLQKADLGEARLHEADLREADLTEVRAEQAVLHGADLTNAILREAWLRGAVFSEANLNGADLQGAYLGEADLQYASLESANLQNAVLPQALLVHANLHRAVLSGARLVSANLQLADLSQSDLRGAYCLNVDFRVSDLTFADLRGADLTGATLLSARLDGAQFDATTILPDGSLWTPETDVCGLTGAIVESQLGDALLEAQASPMEQPRIAIATPDPAGDPYVDAPGLDNTQGLRPIAAVGKPRSAKSTPSQIRDGLLLIGRTVSTEVGSPAQVVAYLREQTEALLNWRTALSAASQTRELVTSLSLVQLQALGYLGLIAFAEILTNLIDPRVGLIAHSCLLLLLLYQASRQWEHPIHRFFLSLAFAPLIRLLSLSLPLAQFKLVYWYLITSVPIFVAVLIVRHVLNLSWTAVGVNLRAFRQQFLVGLAGLVFGYIEYQLLEPDPLVNNLTLRQIWVPALILLFSTGFLEELLFRGIMQRTATETLSQFGLVYVALVFAALHIGYKSIPDLIFVFAVGLFFGWTVQKTHSILGVTLAHGLTNIILFLVIPFLSINGGLRVSDISVTMTGDLAGHNVIAATVVNPENCCSLEQDSFLNQWLSLPLRLEADAEQQ
jgi:uncharacterized protein YjbI with pentapeptide repeats/membrane protease YdiL (CAAX protease family)